MPNLLYFLIKLLRIRSVNDYLRNFAILIVFVASTTDHFGVDQVRHFQVSLRDILHILAHILEPLSSHLGYVVHEVLKRNRGSACALEILDGVNQHRSLSKVVCERNLKDGYRYGEDLQKASNLLQHLNECVSYSFVTISLRP